MSCSDGSFLELEPPLLRAGVLEAPWTPASLSVRQGCQREPLLATTAVGTPASSWWEVKVCRMPPKSKLWMRQSPSTLSPCSSQPLSDESLFRLVFLASINPNSNYYFPYLFSPVLAAVLEAECIFSISSQSRGCIPGLWYMERHGTPANKGPNSLYIPMVLWMACPAQSLQRCQTARRIGIYVSFQSFTNTLLICGLSWPLRELSSYKMEWFFFFPKKKNHKKHHHKKQTNKTCAFCVFYYLSIHNIFIWNELLPAHCTRMFFMHVKNPKSFDNDEHI